MTGNVQFGVNMLLARIVHATVEGSAFIWTKEGKISGSWRSIKEYAQSSDEELHKKLYNLSQTTHEGREAEIRALSGFHI